MTEVEVMMKLNELVHEVGDSELSKGFMSVVISLQVFNQAIREELLPLEDAKRLADKIMKEARNG